MKIWWRRPQFAVRAPLGALAVWIDLAMLVGMVWFVPWAFSLGFGDGLTTLTVLVTGLVVFLPIVVWGFEPGRARWRRLFRGQPPAGGPFYPEPPS